MVTVVNRLVTCTQLLITCHTCVYTVMHICSSFQVYVRLQKMLLSLSHQRTLTYLDCLGEGHDAVVLHWKSDIEKDDLVKGKAYLIF